jgi:GAF domain-containing protein
MPMAPSASSRSPSRASVRQFSEQDLEMLVSVASAAALRVRNVALAEEAAERGALERELAVAHDMQMAMLPREMPNGRRSASRRR